MSFVCALLKGYLHTWLIILDTLLSSGNKRQQFQKFHDRDFNFKSKNCGRLRMTIDKDHIKGIDKSNSQKLQNNYL